MASQIRRNQREKSTKSRDFQALRLFTTDGPTRPERGAHRAALLDQSQPDDGRGNRGKGVVQLVAIDIKEKRLIRCAFLQIGLGA